MREMRNVYKILVEKPKGRRPPGRPRHTEEDNIKMNLRKTGFAGCELDSPCSRQGPAEGS
jgi:hypothetical protein